MIDSLRLFLCIGTGTRTIKSQYAGGILLQPVQKLAATLIFARPTKGQKYKRVPFGVPKDCMISRRQEIFWQQVDTLPPDF